MKSLRCLLLTAALVVACSAGAADYYIKNGGNDGAAGTSDGTAWSSFTNVNNMTLQPGDRVFLKRGSSWNQQLTLNGSGTSGSKIVIDAYGSGNAPLIGRSTQSQGSGQLCIYGYDNNHLVIQNLRCENGFRGIYMYNPSGENYGIEIYNCYFKYFKSLSAEPPSGPPVPVFGAGIYFTHINFNQGGWAPWHDITIDNCTFEECGYGLLIESMMDGLESSGCEAFYCYGGLALTGPTGGVFDNWQIHDCGGNIWCGSTGVYLGQCQQILIEECAIWNQSDGGSNFDGVGVDFEGQNAYCTLSDCYIMNNAGAGVMLNSDYSGPNQWITIRDSLIYNNNTNGSQSANRRYQVLDWDASPHTDVYFTITNSGFYKNGNSVAQWNPDAHANADPHSGGNIFQGYIAGWTPVYGYLTKIDYGGDGQMWGLNGSSIYRWNGDKFTGNCWTPVSGSLSSIGCSPNRVWGVNSSGACYIYKNNQWNLRPGYLSQISAGKDNNIWGLNSGNFIYNWDGSSWDNIAGSLTYITACKENASNKAWGCGGSYVYRYDSGWSQVGGALLQKVSAKSLSTAVGLNGTNVYKTTNGGSSWTYIPGGMKEVSMGADGKIFAIASSNNTIWRLP